jgi:hypothetical protein
VTIRSTSVQVEVEHGAPVSLGYATIESGSLASRDGLAEGRDYSVNYPASTVTFSDHARLPIASFSLRADIPDLVIFTEDVRLVGRVRTTDATPTEVYRLTLLPLTGYTGQVAVIGVDTGNGAVRVIRASFAVKRLNGGALAVGAPVVIASHADAGATAWQIAASVSGNDALVTVSGAAGRVVDWSCTGVMTVFTPSGRTP